MNGGLSMTVTCRKATEEDIETLYEIITGYAEQGIMLPRSRETLAAQLDTFVVAVIDDRLVGCGSLTRLGQDLVEIRSLGVTQGYKGQGIGNEIVSFLVEEAKQQGIPKVMALTYAVNFFERNGFTVVPKEIFPEKVWRDCIHCKKQHCCDEIAVLKRVD
ncbi:MAG: acetyltransferase [Paenibacillus sp.]|jgi:amino-acid N-acetyltransferase|nr:acetyltransferase [Paenibacillus sp.]